MVYNLRDLMKKGMSATEAAVYACTTLAEGDTLCLGGGRIEFYPQGAFKRFYCISNNDQGEKAIVFPLLGKKNVTVDGNGADLVFCGALIPFVVDGSCGVTVKNLSVDYEHPSYCQADIVESDENRVLLRFSEEFPCRVEGGQFIYCGPEGDVPSEEALCQQFDGETGAPKRGGYFYYTGAPKDHGFLRGMYRDVTLHQMGENLIEMRGAFGFAHTIGDAWVCTFGGRDCPGFFVNESKDTRLDGIKLYHTLAMGVIAQLSENITLNAVTADFRENTHRVLTVKADATHFVNCRGKISMTKCKFVSMMDDACNIHGIYLPQLKRLSDHTFEGAFGHYQQEGIRIFREGDEVRIIDSEDQRIVFDGTVVSCQLDGHKILRVTVAEQLPEIAESCVAENISTAPEIYIADTECGNNRPRGFLLSSAGKTLVERCKFYNMYAGIHVGGEMLDWYESGAVRDVTVRDCDFDNSAYAGGESILIRPKIKNPEACQNFHGRVVIENNRFRMHEKRFLSVESVAELVFRGNSYVQDSTLFSYPVGYENGANIERCGQVDFEKVTE